jgi:hypothetical protein
VITEATGLQLLRPVNDSALTPLRYIFSSFRFSLKTALEGLR